MNQTEHNRRFIVILNIPSPYRLHLLRMLGREISRRGLRFHVHFMAKGHVDRPDSWHAPNISFSHTYWKDFGCHTFHWNPGLILHLRAGEPPDYLMVGSAWNTFTGIAASLSVRRRSGILWTEGNTKSPGRLDGVLGRFKRKILACYNYAAVPGKEGVGYLDLHQRRTDKRMPTPVLLPNLIDETRFRERSRWDRQAIDDTRGGLGVRPGERLAISPARLEPCKGLIEFVEALPGLLLDGWRWVIVGEGTLKSRLDEAVEKHGLSDRVTILNYVPYEDMPLLYAAADLFVLPSVNDLNPLSVVEAMHSGLPLLLSKQVGNYPEALREDETGWGFSPFDISEMRQAAQQAFTASTEKLRVYGCAAKARAMQVWGSETAIVRFVDSLEQCQRADACGGTARSR